jgi:hypothetical protein
MGTLDNHRALIVGAGADLPDTVTDAQGLAAILLDPSRCNFPAANVTLLTAGQAQRRNILDALDQLAASAAADATVILYFSGHGYNAQSFIGSSFFLMPNGYAIDDLPGTAISGRELADRLAAIKAGRLLLLLDCCHAGGIADARLPGVTFARSPMPPEAQALFARGSGRIAISSSRADEIALAGQPYGLFTRALLECLAGQGVSKLDGCVRALDLALYAREKVPAWSQERQHPLADIDQADNFVVAYYANGAREPRPLDLPPLAQAASKPQAGVTIGSVNVSQSQGVTIAPTGPITQNFGPMTNTGGGDANTGSGDIVHGDKADARHSQGFIYKPTGPITHNKIDTGGGAYVGGNVQTGGDFVGRDQVTAGGSSDDGSAGAPAMSPQALQLYALLTGGAFELDDLEDLAFRLNIEWGSLAGGTIAAKARSLTRACAKTDRLPDLEAVIKEVRPNLIP